MQKELIVIAGFGGIGQALFEQYATKDYELVVLSRKQQTLNKGRCITLNMDSESDVAEAIKSLDACPSIVINTCGLLHDDSLMPEKALRDVTRAHIQHSIDANVIPTLHLAKAITTRLNRQTSTRFVSFSARVSSISDNRLGGWHSYRMSKAMLNMLIKNIALEWKIKSPHSIISGYHPGTVKTKLSEPFIKENTPCISADEAASYASQVIEKLSSKHSGELLDWQGKVIAP